MSLQMAASPWRSRQGPDVWLATGLNRPGYRQLMLPCCRLAVSLLAAHLWRPSCLVHPPTFLLSCYLHRQAGDLVTFPKGMSCTWDVKEVRPLPFDPFLVPVCLCRLCLQCRHPAGFRRPVQSLPCSYVNLRLGGQPGTLAHGCATLPPLVSPMLPLAAGHPQALQLLVKLTSSRGAPSPVWKWLYLI